MDFRKRQKGDHAPIHNDRAEVVKVSDFKFLGVFFKDYLTWSRQADSVVENCQKVPILPEETGSLACLQKLLPTFPGAPFRASSPAALLPGMAAAPLLNARPSRGW